AKTKSVWDAWPDEMTKKAMIKRASKQWPSTDRENRLAKVIDFVNEEEGSEAIRPERDITPKAPEPKPKQPITNARLNAGIAKIQAGEYYVAQLEQSFELTPEQDAKVFEFVATG